MGELNAHFLSRCQINVLLLAVGVTMTENHTQTFLRCLMVPQWKQLLHSFSMETITPQNLLRKLRRFMSA